MNLYDDVLQKCSQQRWFGTDSMLWLQQERERRGSSLPDITGCLEEHFYYTPATEEQIQSIETALGFPLPLELRSLYQHVANGGFGPDNGFIGLTGGCTISFLEGYPEITNWADIERIFEVRLADVYRIQTENAELVDFEMYRTTSQKQGWVELPYTIFPRYMCTFGYADGSMGYTIDATTGAIYCCEGATASTYRLLFLASSLAQWLQPWLQGTWVSAFTERLAKPYIYVRTEESEVQQQQQLATIEHIRQSLYQEPRQFHGPHAQFLERIHQRCLALGGLIFHPATEEQVQVAEARLGQILPSLLRDIYLQIGNGGFGPTYGLHGLENGYPYGDKTIVDSYLQETGTVRGVHVSDYEQEIRQTGAFMIPSGGPLPQAKPLGCICLSDDGCGMESWLHLDSQRVFRSEYWGTMHMQYRMLASSLEKWFESWLAEDCEQSRWIFQHMIDHVGYSDRTR